MIEVVATAVAWHPLAVFAVFLAVVLPTVAAGLQFVRASAGPSRRTALAAVVIALGVIVFAVLASGLDGSAVSVRFDEALALALTDATSPTLAWIVASITHLGDRATLIAVVVVVSVLLVALRRRGFALAWVLTCAGNGVLNPALKAVFERARPVHDAAYAVVGEYSFPSGHTSGSVVVYGMLAYLAIRVVPARRRMAIALFAATLVCVVACSRIYLRVHWASDVAAGFASGTAWLALCIAVVERARERASSLNRR